MSSETATDAGTRSASGDDGDGSKTADGPDIATSAHGLLRRFVRAPAMRIAGALLAASVTPLAPASVNPTGFERKTGADRPDPAESRDDWTVDVSVADPDGVAVGDEVTVGTTVRDVDVRQFARATGDTNPLHLDETYAEETRYDGRIAHGTLASGLNSTGMAYLPGVVSLLALEQEFVAPIEVGDRVTATVEVVEALGSDRYRLRTSVKGADGTVCLQGEATVLVDASPDE